MEQLDWGRLPCSFDACRSLDEGGFSALVTARVGWVAQLAEQWTENPRVGGSIPPPARPLIQSMVRHIDLASMSQLETKGSV